MFFFKSAFQVSVFRFYLTSENQLLLLPRNTYFLSKSWPNTLLFKNNHFLEQNKHVQIKIILAKQAIICYPAYFISRFRWSLETVQCSLAVSLFFKLSIVKSWWYFMLICLSGCCRGCRSVFRLHSWAFHCWALRYFSFMDVCQLLDNWCIVYSGR